MDYLRVCVVILVVAVWVVNMSDSLPECIFSLWHKVIIFFIVSLPFVSYFFFLVIEVVKL